MTFCNQLYSNLFVTFVAEKILHLAEAHKIPFFEDPSLTDLLAKLELNSDVPPEMYTLVAEVLAFVYQLDKMAKKRSGINKNCC